MDPFASHVLRALLLLLAPDVLAPIVGDAHDASGKVRSKKSAAYKARQGSMKSVFTDVQEQSQRLQTKRVPKEFREAASQIVATLRDALGENEVRALAANQVASPVLQVKNSFPDSRGLVADFLYRCCLNWRPHMAWQILPGLLWTTHWLA